MSKAALDALLQYLVKSAVKLVDAHGAAHPLAAVVDRQLIVAAFSADGDDSIASLVDGLRGGAARGEYVAVGYCFEVTARRGEVAADALQVQLEDADGTALAVVVPYLRTRGRIEVREPNVTVCAPEVFVVH